VGAAGLTREELETAHCWETDDRVPARSAMTEFRRRLRYHQAQWREANGHPIGSQPIVPKAGIKARSVGSRLPVAYAQETGANFLTARAVEAARARASHKEAHQSFDHQRFWADLLWSPALAVNLFGDLAADVDLAGRAVHAWLPDAPGTVREVRFTHSPGWLDAEFLNSLRAFDAAFVVDLGGGDNGIVAVDVKYHEWSKPETPKPENMPRYREVAKKSAAFRRRATAGLAGRSGLAVMWLEHLLLLSMLQHPSGRWRWGRYVVVHPAGNSDIADACTRYRGFLADDSTFSCMTLEDLLDSGALPARTTRALRDRYVPA
jgi:PD-(D/E)XK nuclease superfamily